MTVWPHILIESKSSSTSTPLNPAWISSKRLKEASGSCDVLIAVIGAYWVNAADEQGYRRLDNPEDFVRMEIATALRREIRVIPVLIDGASMPKMAELPDDLKPLVRRNALPLSDTRFDDDCRRLLATIEQVFESIKAERSGFTETVRPERGPLADQRWEKAGRERLEDKAPSVLRRASCRGRTCPGKAWRTEDPTGRGESSCRGGFGACPESVCAEH